MTDVGAQAGQDVCAPPIQSADKSAHSKEGERIMECGDLSPLSFVGHRFSCWKESADRTPEKRRQVGALLCECPVGLDKNYVSYHDLKRD